MVGLELRLSGVHGALSMTFTCIVKILSVGCCVQFEGLLVACLDCERAAATVRSGNGSNVYWSSETLVSSTYSGKMISAMFKHMEPGV